MTDIEKRGCSCTTTLFVCEAAYYEKQQQARDIAQFEPPGTQYIDWEYTYWKDLGLAGLWLDVSLCIVLAVMLALRPLGPHSYCICCPCLEGYARLSHLCG